MREAIDDAPDWKRIAFPIIVSSSVSWILSVKDHSGLKLEIDTGRMTIIRELLSKWRKVLSLGFATQKNQRYYL